MKEIKKENKREVVETIVTYEAVDGTVFSSKEECQKYEDSAFGVLMGRTKDFTVNEGNNMNPFDDSDENEYKMLKPRNKEDIDTLNQLYFLPSYRKEEKPRFTDEYIGKLILMGWRTCEGVLDWSWFYDMDKAIASLTGDKYKLVEV